jgi:hypothetical protein
MHELDGSAYHNKWTSLPIFQTSTGLIDIQNELADRQIDRLRRVLTEQFRGCQRITECVVRMTFASWNSRHLPPRTCQIRIRSLHCELTSSHPSRTLSCNRPFRSLHSLLLHRIRLDARSNICRYFYLLVLFDVTILFCTFFRTSMPSVDVDRSPGSSNFHSRFTDKMKMKLLKKSKNQLYTPPTVIEASESTDTSAESSSLSSSSSSSGATSQSTSITAPSIQSSASLSSPVTQQKERTRPKSELYSSSRRNSHIVRHDLRYFQGQS